MLQKLRGDKGFTLIELMIVIAIIGILAAIAIPNFISYRDKAYCQNSESDAQNTIAAISSYFSEPDNTAMPGVTKLLDATSNNGADLSLNNDATHVSITPAAGVAAGGATITVSVTDTSLRCPRGTYYTVTMGAATGGAWQ